MKGVTTLSALAAVALSLSACNPAPPVAPDTHDADVKAISDLEAQTNQAWAAKDADKVIAFYADDAVFIVSGMEAIQGKDAIRASLKGMLSDPAVSLTFKASKVDVAKSGDLAYTEGPYQLTVTDPATHKPVQDHGNYATTFHKQADGSWRAVVDVAASAVPPPAPSGKKK
jgi:uncharacterized protein (TIGR02246 family)